MNWDNINIYGDDYLLDTGCVTTLCPSSLYVGQQNWQMNMKYETYIYIYIYVDCVSAQIAWGRCCGISLVLDVPAYAATVSEILFFFFMHGSVCNQISSVGLYS